MVVGNISFWAAEVLGRAFCLPTFLLCKEAMESCFWRLADTVRNWQADDFWFDVHSILLTQAIFYSLEWACEPFRQSVPPATEQPGKANSLLSIPLQTSAVQPLTRVLSEQEESEFQQTSASWQLRPSSLSRVRCLAGIQQEEVNSGVCPCVTHTKEMRMEARLFYFILRASTEMFQRCHLCVLPCMNKYLPKNQLEGF